MKFVAAVAAGKTQTAAYKDAGYATNGKPRTAVRNARQLAQNAAVRAAIEEMQLRLLPAPENLQAIYAHGLARMIQLSNCEDRKVSEDAAKWLCAEAERQIEKRRVLEATKVPERRRETDREIIEELRMLYRKALPEMELPEREPPLVEAVRDGIADDQAGETPAENLPRAADAPEDAAEMREPEERRPEYRMLPGRFPPQRIRVR
jgi:hypothetical protein